jgi:Predicted metal binding domain
MTTQVIDPEISRVKFESELKKFRDAAGYQQGRGVVMIKAEYPEMIISFFAVQLKPAALVFTVKFNFENYDMEPLSVRFIDLFTGNALPKEANLFYKTSVPGQLANFCQKDEQQLPFLCLPGVKEYHDHPAHTGDSWLLHRNVGGEGSLGFLVDKLYQYGVKPLLNYAIPINTLAQAQTVQFAMDPNSID